MGLAFVATVFVFFSFWLWWKFIADIRPKPRPKLRRRAIVKGKRDDRNDNYFIGFIFTDGQEPQEHEYQVPGSHFSRLQAGDEIDIYFEGKNYHDFKRV